MAEPLTALQAGKLLHKHMVEDCLHWKEQHDCFFTRAHRQDLTLLVNAARVEVEARHRPAPVPKALAIIVQEPSLTPVEADAVELAAVIDEVERLKREAESVGRERSRIINDVFGEDRGEKTRAVDDRLDKLQDQYTAAQEHMELLLELIDIASLPAKEPNP